MKHCVLATTLLALLPCPAAAASAPSDAATSRPTTAVVAASKEDAVFRDVEVTAAGEPVVIEAMGQRLRALLREYPVVVHWTETQQFRPRDVFVADENAALARIWLDARGSSRVVLYLVDDAHERFLVRVVPLDSGYDEVAYESVGTIVQSSVDALLAGASVGVNRQTAQAQVAALEPTSEAAPDERASPRVSAPRVRAADESGTRAQPSHRRLALDLSYRGQAANADPVVLHGPELGLALEPASDPGVSAGFALGYRVPVHWAEQGVGARFSGAGARVAVGVGGALTARASLALLAVAGVDWLHVVPEVSSSANRARVAFELLAPSVGLMLEWQLLVTRRWATWLALGVERDLFGNHFDVVRDGRRSTVLAPWPVIPVLRLGVRGWVL